ncbi:MAG: MerR family transcriptional regulator [Clostridiales bacterium]|nr:MerR family transcriptional regulator [Clostridiales bacterium]
MEKHRAIPQGFMTVGEVAKKMNTTVRTLQYYDREGLLVPSAESEGGRRLYGAKDIIRLHQIQTMKYLGFSLNDIANRLPTIDTPEEFSEMLTEHASVVREKISSLTESLEAIEALREEVRQIREVDFKKYADIVLCLQRKNEYYWMIKNFDNKTLDTLTQKYDDDESKKKLQASVSHVVDTAIRYQADGIKPESAEGQELAEKYWNFLMEVTDGDMEMFSKLSKAAENSNDSSWKKKHETADGFLGSVLDIYFKKLGIKISEQKPLCSGGE